MTDKAKLSLSYICTSVAFIMAITSGMILCACPEWPAIGVGFAVTALWLRKGKAPLLPTLALVANLAMTGLALREEYELPGSNTARRRAAREARAHQRAAANEAPVAATNSAPAGPTTMTNRNP